jgi:hypothetical protein
LSRINRFILSPDWEQQFPDVFQRRLPRLLSNHFPLLLDCDIAVRGGRYFKFENMLLKLKGFVKHVKLGGCPIVFKGSPNFILARKLRALKNESEKME